MAEPALSFAGLLRQLRAEARLTQEELAEAASLSPRSVSDLERGISRTARKDTAILLADALNLAADVRGLFVAAARGKAPAAEVLAARQGMAPGAFAAATRALPRDIASFTGRQAELLVLESLAGAAAGGVVGIHAVSGMAGVGKTTFAVHAAHQLAGSFPDGQFFLPLHAHTPGQGPVDPADALASLLLTAGVAAPQIPPGLEARAGRWRDHVAGKKILLLLDDAAGHDQVRPLLPGTADSLVLITSRRRLTALEDATVISLDTLTAGEAATLLVRLAGRPQMRAADAATGEIIRLCGYLPLAIGMIASQLRHHPARAAARLAGELAEARDRLAIMRAENLSVAAAFDLSYQDLTPGARQLFRRLGLIPGPSFDVYAAAALDDTSLDQARRHLDELYDLHLVAEPAAGRYRLHDLLREHARSLAAGHDHAESAAAAGRLLNYYLHTALAADLHMPTWTAALKQPPPGRRPARAPSFSGNEQAAAWLETERPNLHAATTYAAAAGLHLHAVQIPAAVGGFLRARGYWDEAMALHQAAMAIAAQDEDQAALAGALSQLGILQREAGSYPAAAAALTRAAQHYDELGDQIDQAYVLNHLGVVQQLTSDYGAALTSHQRALALARNCGDKPGQANALSDLADAQQLTGDYQAAAISARQAIALYRDAGNRLGLADALMVLGAVQADTGDHPAAAISYQQALDLFSALQHRLGQAYAHDALAVIHRLTGDFRAATAGHQYALRIFRALGHRFGEAKALNELGELAAQTSAADQARNHYLKALAIARDIGASREEACALEGLGGGHLKDGSSREAAQYLHQALAIYQRISAPDARRVQDMLRDRRRTSHSSEPPEASRPLAGSDEDSLGKAHGNAPAQRQP